MDASTRSAVGFVIALIVSTIIIYLAAKPTGEKEGIGIALLAAFIGTIVCTAVYFLLSNGLLTAVEGEINSFPAEGPVQDRMAEGLADCRPRLDPDINRGSIPADAE
jgi:hypothetical protein